MGADYYELLGVSRDADPTEIKRAFRALARQYHPDVATDDADAEARFKEVARAYEVLSDPEKRARYDQFGEQGVAGGGDPFVGVSVNDLFDAFFGGDVFGDAFGRGGRGQARGPDAEVRVELDLADAVTGSSHTIEARLPVACETCDASGAATGTEPVVCTACGGAGEIREVRRSILGQIVSARACPTCRGMGRVISSPCSDCGGEGRVTRLRRLEVDVPAGIDNGQRLRLAGKGPAAPRGGYPGDLFVDISVRDHLDFERHGDDLLRVLPVSVAQAVLGVAVPIETFDGTETLVVPPGTQSGAQFRLRARGVPHLRGHGRGDLVVEVRVDIPRDLDEEQDAMFRRLAELREEEVAPPDRSFFERLRSAFTS